MINVIFNKFAFLTSFFVFLLLKIVFKKRSVLTRKNGPYFIRENPLKRVKTSGFFPRMTVENLMGSNMLLTEVNYLFYISRYSKKTEKTLKSDKTLKIPPALTRKPK